MQNLYRLDFDSSLLTRFYQKIKNKKTKKNTNYKSTRDYIQGGPILLNILLIY